jgi:hypothetical protein
VLQDVFMFLEFSYTVLLRGGEGWSKKANLSKFQLHSHLLTRELLPDIVRAHQILFEPTPNSKCHQRNLLSDIVRISNLCLTASFLGEPYKYPSNSNGSPSWPLRSTGSKAHFFHLQRPKLLSPKAFIPSSWSRDWVKQGFEFIVWFTFSSSS